MLRNDSMPAFSPHLKGILITIGGVLILSPDSLLIRLTETDPWTLLFWRGLLMAIGLTVLVSLRTNRGLKEAFRAIGRKGVLVSGIVGIGTILFVLAIIHTTVANTLIILGAGPLFAAVFSCAFLKEPVAPRTWIAIFSALCGITITVSNNLQSGLLLGDLCALGSACCMGAQLAVLRSTPEIDMAPSVAIGGLLAAALVFPLAAPWSVGGNDIWFLLLLGLIVLPLSLGLIVLGPQYLPAPEVSLLMLLEMVIGPYWVWLALGEQPGTRAWIGGAVVMATLAAHSAVGLRQERRRVGQERTEASS